MEDLLYKLLNIYRNLPYPIKFLIGKLYNGLPMRYRYGTFYFHYTKRIHRFNQIANYQQIEKEQQTLLLKEVNYAIEHIRYYQKYAICNSISDLNRLPVITKDDIINNYNDFINIALKNRSLKTNTGGSSGNPLEFYLEKNISRSKEKAHFSWYWGQFGYKNNDKIMVVRGMPLKGNKLYEYQPIDNTLNISCYLINVSNVNKVVEQINKFNPSFIHAYPSSLKILTESIIKVNAKLNVKIRAAFLGSEHLYQHDKKLFADFYQCKIVNWYGHSERLIHGGYCPYSDEYHFYPYYGFIELVDEQNQIITEPGKEGKIIATGFDNKIMPFIRYDTGDIGVLTDKQTCACGFKGTMLKEVKGRGQDFIYLTDGTKVSLTAFIFGQHLNQFSDIREIQIIQKKRGEINILLSLVTPNQEFNTESFVKTLTSSVNNKIKIDVNFVDKIPKTKRGKHILLKQYIM